MPKPTHQTHTAAPATSTNGIILESLGITKSYGRAAARNRVLQGVDLTVRRGEFVAVMGKSGCGKSTLLHILGLMSRPDDGRLIIQGRDVTSAPEAERTALRRRTLGFVFQRFNLLTTVSAADNIAISLRIRGLKAPAELIGRLLDRMDVGHVGRRKSGKMSIGEQQRVAVARALAHRPELLLADEPTGCLDSANSDALLGLLGQANADGQTVIMITHSADNAARADRILHMKDGRIEDAAAAPAAPSTAAD